MRAGNSAPFASLAPVAAARGKPALSPALSPAGRSQRSQRSAARGLSPGSVMMCATRNIDG